MDESSADADGASLYMPRKINWIELKTNRRAIDANLCTSFGEMGLLHRIGWFKKD